jgi:ketosteroid isomerase-like protein
VHGKAKNVGPQGFGHDPKIELAQTELNQETVNCFEDQTIDIVSFDVVDPLRYTGVHIVRERAEKWFAFCETAIGCEVRDLNIATGSDVAFCHYIYRVTGIRTDGVKVDMWVRTTVCLRKTGDTWLIVHEHQSVPFNPEGGKASLDLKP